MQSNPNLIFPAGTQVVTLQQVRAPNGNVAHPAGAVGVVVRAPSDRQHAYRVKFPDGLVVALQHHHLMLLAEYQQLGLAPNSEGISTHGLFGRVIFRCVIGSRAYGLETEDSDTDRRGVYLPPAEMHWSLYGVPEQLEHDDNQEAYWELQKFLVLALKANPNVLECLYSPLVESATPLGEELILMRSSFLSSLVYQTYNGYVMSQFKRMQSDLRNQGKRKPKHVMHLIRLLLAGIHVLREGEVPVDVGDHRDALLSIRRDEMPWPEIDRWRLELHQQFDHAREHSSLPERPDYERANQFLVKSRRLAINSQLP